jgi:ABC-type amino acid transport substrate-binding protein
VSRVAASAAAVVLAALALPAASVADTTPPAAPAAAPRAFVVALGLGDPALQAGVLRGREVILARGFEVELARILARRLGGRVDRFVHVASPARALASGGADWQLAFAGIEPEKSMRAGADLSTPYLTTDVVVVARRGLDRPRRAADLRSTLLCAVRGGEGAQAAASLRPKRGASLLPNTGRLLTAVRTGACDAALVPADEAGRFVAGHRRVLGPVVGRIRHGAGVVAAVTRGSGLAVADVNRELARLRRDGTLGRLARTWLGLDPAAVPVLR